MFQLPDPPLSISLDNAVTSSPNWRTRMGKALIQPFQAQRSPLVVHHWSIRIRPARPQDSFGIGRVVQAAVAGLIGPLYTRRQIDAWIADEAARILAPEPPRGCTVLAAESQGHIIAFSRLHGDEIEALYVHPARAGRRIGHLLLRATEKCAWVRGIRALQLDAALNAVRFYESAGYKVLCPSRPVLDSGVTLPCLRMEKTLQPAALRWRRQRDHSIPPVAASASASPSRLPSVLSRRML